MYYSKREAANQREGAFEGEAVCEPMLTPQSQYCCGPMLQGADCTIALPPPFGHAVVLPVDIIAAS